MSIFQRFYSGLLFLLLATNVCQAAPLKPSWDNIGIGYTYITDSEDDDFTPQGLSLTLNKLITNNIYFTTDYSQTTETYLDIDMEFKAISAGLGYIYSFNYTTDFFVDVNYEYLEVKGTLNENSESLDDNGYSIKTGILARWFIETELELLIKHTIVDSDTQTDFGFGFKYFLTNNVRLGLDYLSGNSQKTYNLNLSYSF